MADPGFDDIFLAHHKELALFLERKLGCPDTAADLVQDTFLRFKPLYETPPGVRQVRAYLFRIARNLMIDHLRRERSQQTDTVPVEELASVVELRPGPEQQVSHRERLRILREAIDQLPPRSRDVFVMSRVHGMSFVEIGERLGISPKTAFSHMTRALVLLKSHLDEGSDS